MSKEAMNTDFNEWFNRNEGFHIKSKRFYESLMPLSNERLAIIMVTWLEAAFEAGQAAENEACERVAGIALLGSEKALADRVRKAIRARVNT